MWFESGLENHNSAVVHFWKYTTNERIGTTLMVVQEICSQSHQVLSSGQLKDWKQEETAILDTLYLPVHTRTHSHI